MSLIKAIKITQRQLHIDQATHEANVRHVSNGRAKSSTNLSPREQRELLGIYRGMQPKQASFTLPKQVQLIYSLWTQLHQVGAVRIDSKEACDEFCSKYLNGKTILQSPSQWSSIIESMKQWKARIVREAELGKQEQPNE